MEQREKFTQQEQVLFVKPRQSKRAKPLKPKSPKVGNMSERTNLETHVELCELRYKQLDDRMSKIEKQVQDLNIDLQDFKDENRKSFAEIKDLIEKKTGSNNSAIVTAAGTVIVSLIGFLGYLLTHVK
jgi:transposase